MEKKEYLKYCLGGLIYTPATDKKIAEKLRSKAIPNLKSLVLCQIQFSVKRKLIQRKFFQN